MRLRLPDLLATRVGRLAAFFLLYVTEGIPSGFTTIAIATHMRREGVNPAAIGAYVGALYLPWGFKWAVGPIVDTFRSARHGHYRLWIMLTQVGLVGALLAAMPIQFSAELGLFTAILLVHNVFGATQDVAIDALAINVLHEDERGTASGFMFAGQTLGIAIGGSGVLYLTQVMPFRMTYLFVAAAIVLITVFVVAPLKEPPGPPRAARTGPALAAIGAELASFVEDAYRAFVGSRGASVGVLFALLPTGAYALGLALQSNLAVELGLDDARVADLAVWSGISGAAGCIVGGWLSDKFSRRWSLALFIIGTSLPTVWLAWTLQRAGWIHPVNTADPHHMIAGAALLSTFWTMVITFNWFNGLMYGASIALYMDVTTPRVAATQFTAYMAIANLCTSYSAVWQGHAIERFGYPVTLLLDGTFGLVALALLPYMTPLPRSAGVADVPPGSAIPQATA